jgi:hypothetical protein
MKQIAPILTISFLIIAACKSPHSTVEKSNEKLAIIQTSQAERNSAKYHCQDLGIIPVDMSSQLADLGLSTDTRMALHDYPQFALKIQSEKDFSGTIHIQLNDDKNKLIQTIAQKVQFKKGEQNTLSLAFDPQKDPTQASKIEITSEE